MRPPLLAVAAVAALLALGVAATALAAGGSGEHGGAARLALTSAGCGDATVRIPADGEPAMLLVNEAAQSMVVSVPKIALAVAVPPGGTAEVALPRYIMGDFPLYCVSDAAHAAAGGHTSRTQLVCGLDDSELAPVALGAGTLSIEPHDRIREVLQDAPPPTKSASDGADGGGY